MWEKAPHNDTLQVEIPKTESNTFIYIKFKIY